MESTVLFVRIKIVQTMACRIMIISQFAANMERIISMTSKVSNKLGYMAVFILLFSFWGCASDPVQVDFPANHPAKPEAAEAAYTAVPNPFKDAGSINEMNFTDSPSMPHQGRGDSPAHKMKPMHDKGHKDPENSTGAETEKSSHQHQEHN